MRAVVAVLLFVTAVHAAMWGVFRDKQEAPDFKGILPSLSYAPFEGTAHPDVDNIPNVEKIRADMKKLAPLTRAIPWRKERKVPTDACFQSPRWK